MKNTITLLVFLFSILSLTYSQTVTIGTQVWMNKNLDVSTFRNGDPIPQAKTEQDWLAAKNNKQPAWCYYENKSENGAKFGKLYNWYAVNDARGLAPVGFHVPSDEEWMKLIDYLGGENLAGIKMKEKEMPKTEIYFEEEGGYNELKYVPCSNCKVSSPEYKKICPVCKGVNGKTVKTGKYIPKTKTKKSRDINLGWDGTNESSFSALPAGQIDSWGTFYYASKNAYWWSTTEDLIVSDDESFNDHVYGRNLECKYGYVNRGWHDKGDGLSVRCIRD